jgi:transcriptional regulator with XRE-family HTH domain
MEPEEIGRRIRERRRQEGLSQEGLANHVGISRNYLSQIERGQATNLSWQVMGRLTSALGLMEEQQSNVGQELKNLSPSLVEFIKEVNLPPNDIQMLANLYYRGRQPTTKEKWKLLYNVIKMTTEK